MDTNIVVRIVHITESFLAVQYTCVLSDILNDLTPWALLQLVFLVSSTPQCLMSHPFKQRLNFTYFLSERRFSLQKAPQ